MTTPLHLIKLPRSRRRMRTLRRNWALAVLTAVGCVLFFAAPPLIAGMLAGHLAR